MPPTGQFGYKKRLLSGVKPGKRGRQNRFWNAVARFAA
jgi:hypothetical protein